MSAARQAAPCEYLGCSTGARWLVEVSPGPGWPMARLRLCQAHLLALGRRAHVVHTVR